MDEDLDITFTEAIKPALVITVSGLALYAAGSFVYSKIQERRRRKKDEENFNRIRLRSALGLEN